MGGIIQLPSGFKKLTTYMMVVEASASFMFACLDNIHLLVTPDALLGSAALLLHTAHQFACI